MYLATISIASDCGLSSAATLSNEKVITLSISNFNDLNNIIAFTISDDIKEIKEGIYRDFKDFSILKGKNSSVIFGIKKSHGIIPSINKTKSIPLLPFYADNGTETFHLLTINKESLEKLTSMIEQNNRIESISYEKLSDANAFYVSLRKINRYTLMYKLTEMEAKIIKKALDEGFYSWPRSYNLDAISRSFNLTKPTILYHIRSAERKIINSLLGE